MEILNAGEWKNLNGVQILRESGVCGNRFYLALSNRGKTNKLMLMKATRRMNGFEMVALKGIDLTSRVVKVSRTKAYPNAATDLASHWILAPKSLTIIFGYKNEIQPKRAVKTIMKKT